MKPNVLDATDLFVLLERAFHRRSRGCRGCLFSLPFRVSAGGGARWSVVASQSCSTNCRAILEDLLEEFQTCYRLSDSTHG